MIERTAQDGFVHYFFQSHWKSEPTASLQAVPEFMDRHPLDWVRVLCPVRI